MNSLEKECIAFPLNILSDKSLSLGEKITYSSLLHIIDSEQNNEIRISHLAHLLSVSYHCVYRFLNMLEEKGYIKLEHSHSRMFFVHLKHRYRA